MQPTATQQNKLKKTNLLHNVVVGASSTVATTTNGGGSVCPNMTLTDNVNYCVLLASATDNNLCENYDQAFAKYAKIHIDDDLTPNFCNRMQEQLIGHAKARTIDFPITAGTSQYACKDAMTVGVKVAHEMFIPVQEAVEYFFTQSGLKPRSQGMSNVYENFATRISKGLLTYNGMSVEDACEWGEKMHKIESMPESVYMYETAKKWTEDWLIGLNDTENIETRSAMAAVLPALAVLQDYESHRVLLNHIGPVMAQKFADTLEKCVSPKDFAMLTKSLRVGKFDGGKLAFRPSATHDPLPLDDTYNEMMRNYARHGTNGDAWFNDLFSKLLLDRLDKLKTHNQVLAETVVAFARGFLLYQCSTIEEKNALMQNKLEIGASVNELKEAIKTWDKVPYDEVEPINKLLSGQINDTVEYYTAVDTLERAVAKQFPTPVHQPEDKVCEMKEIDIETYCTYGMKSALGTMKQNLNQIHPKYAAVLEPQLEKCINGTATAKDSYVLAASIRQLCEADESDGALLGTAAIVGICLGIAFAGAMTALASYLCYKKNLCCSRGQSHHAVSTTEI